MFSIDFPILSCSFEHILSANSLHLDIFVPLSADSKAKNSRSADEHEGLSFPQTQFVYVKLTKIRDTYFKMRIYLSGNAPHMATWDNFAIVPLHPNMFLFPSLKSLCCHFSGLGYYVRISTSTSFALNSVYLSKALIAAEKKAVCMRLDYGAEANGMK